MGFVFTLILIIAVITALAYTDGNNVKVKRKNALTAAIICGCIGLAVMLLIWGISYSNFIGMKKDLAVVEQYKESVELYAEKGVAEFKPGSGAPSELTDLKYNHYQSQIGRMIADLRDKIVDYNEAFAGKRTMKDSWYWSWCIILPDDMKMVKMADYIR